MTSPDTLRLPRDAISRSSDDDVIARRKYARALAADKRYSKMKLMVVKSKSMQQTNSRGNPATMALDDEDVASTDSDFYDTDLEEDDAPPANGVAMNIYYIKRTRSRK